MSRAVRVSVVLRVDVPDVERSGQVKALLAELPPTSEVLVVGDERAAGELTRSDPDRIRLVPGATGSSAQAFAVGAAQASGSLLLFAEGSFEIQAGKVAPLLEAVEDPTAGLVGPALLPWEHRDQPVAGLTYVDAAMNTRWMSVGPGISEAPVIAGPLVAIRRDAYEQVGGYDVGFGAGGFHHHALSMQAWRAGYRCLVVPASEVAYPFPVAPAEGPAWLVHLRDLVRLVSLHLDPPELVVALSAICSNEAFPMAAGQLLDEDLAARRAQLAERSVETVAAVLGRLCGPIFAAGDRTPLGPAPEAAGGQGPAPYAEANRKVWAHWASSGAHSSRPVVRSDLEGARDTLDPEGWLSWSELSTVLCLGAGGGQQAPLFASLGYEVTLLDLSPEQLALDRQVADALELSLEIVEGDMLDLTVLGGRVFDLVFQPVSACYIPDVHLLYEQVRLVTRPGGQYLVEHWNPTQIQLEGHGQWDGTGYRLVHPQGGGRPVLWEVPGRGPEVEPLTTWHYIHPLTDLIGGMLRAGFSIRRFAERWEGDPTADPGTERHLASFAPPFLRILAESPAGPDSPAGSRHS